MPNKNGTSPLGQGSKTGQGLGPCKNSANIQPPHLGFGRGQGHGKRRGTGLGRGRHTQTSGL